jgi:hypothetical protein
MNFAAIWKSSAVIFTILFIVVTDIPISRFGISFCVSRCSSNVKLSNGDQYALYDSDLYGTEALYRSRYSFGILWMSVSEAKILEIWEIYDPAKLIISPDEKLLFVQRGSPVSPASNRRGELWSDLVDVSGGEARLVIGGGPSCCTEQDYERLRTNNERIGKIAASLGVTAP